MNDWPDKFSNYSVALSWIENDSNELGYYGNA